jgi:nitroreductase
VVVSERDGLASLARLWQGAGHVAHAAAAIAIVAPIQSDETRRSWVQYDLGQLTMSLMLAATDLGIGSAHAWVTDQENARELLGFPNDHELAWLLALGHPAEGPLTPLTRINRRDFDDVVHRERW